MPPNKGNIGFSQIVHPELIAKIQEFVSIGTVDPIDVRLLKHHVKHVLVIYQTQMIEHTIPVLTISETKAKRALQLSVVDQENAQKIIEQQQKLSTDSHTYFRPYRYAKSDKDGQIDDKDIQTDDKDDQTDDQMEQTLLWVHQEPWQQQLLLAYGNTMFLMDAIYKTTRYDLPLFFICVRTNAGYYVVAEFII